MNQQVSLPNLGGLLSLDLNMLPQTAAGGELAGADLMSGFGALLNQLAAAGEVVPGLTDGQMLPQSGLNLPASDMSQPELLQQQLEQLAAMLQQQGTEGADRLAELAAKIADALSQAQAEGALPAHELTNDSVELPVVDADVVVQSTVPSEAGQGDGDPDPQSSVEVATAVDAVITTAAQQSDPGEEVSTESGTAAEVEDDPAASMLLASESPEENTAEDIEVPVQSKEPSADVDEADPDQVPVIAQATGAQEMDNVQADESSDDQSADEVGSLPDRSRSRAAEHASEQAVFALSERANERAAQRSAVLATATDAAENLVRSAASPADTGRGKGQKPQADNIAARPVDLTGQSVADNSQKSDSKAASVAPEPPIDLGKKLEMTLKDAQALLRSVSGQKSGADVQNSAANRSDTVAALTTETYSLQTIQQPSASQKVQTEGQTLMMPNQTRLNSPAWHTALGERAVMITTQGARTAEIRLDPPELGSLHIRVHLHQDQVSLSFSSPHAQVRDAIEQSLPRLREMFAEQGLALQDSSVSDQSQGERRDTESQQLTGRRGAGLGGAGEAGELPGGQPELAGRPVSLVDYYA